MPSPTTLRLALASLLFLWSCGEGPQPQRARLSIGSTAPELRLPSLDGQIFDLRSMAGKPVVLNFWATWCRPCRQEIPELVALSERNDIEVVGVALDQEGARIVQPFVDRHGIAYTVLLGDQETFERFQGYSIPYTLVLDADRRITDMHRGPVRQSMIRETFSKRAIEQGVGAAP